MKHDITKVMAEAERLIPIVDERQRAMLETFRMHALLEIAGKGGEEILSPNLAVDHPIYYFRYYPDGTHVLDGRDAVLAFYQKFIDDRVNVIYTENASFAFADWGLVFNGESRTYTPGRIAKARGFDVDDVDATYLISHWTLTKWEFDRDGVRMVGEDVYRAQPHGFVKLAAEDVITPEQASAALAPALEKFPFYTA